MKKLTLLTALVGTLLCADMNAQFRNGNRWGRQSTIPQTPSPQAEEEPKTADEIVDQQMPKISESLELNPFEEAVVRATLVKYLQKSMELQILQVEPTKMKEAYENLLEQQKEELRAGLPQDKFEAFLELQENRYQIKRKKKKKKKKSKEKDEIKR